MAKAQEKNLKKKKIINKKREKQAIKISKVCKFKKTIFWKISRQST